MKTDSSTGAVRTAREGDGPWRIGLESARANLVPGLVLQVAAAALVLAYYFVPGVDRVLAPVAEWQRREGWVAAFLSRAFFCGILPGVFLLSIPSLRPKRPLATILLNCLWWGGMGIVVSWLYLAQRAIFGDGLDFLTLLEKTLVDQFIYTPFFASPLNTVYNFWLGCDLSFTATRRAWPSGWLRHLLLPNLLPNWALWFPALFAVYALPEPLQIHLSGIIGCFWTLMCLQIGVRTLCART